jgi:hypothetical protein
MIQTPKLEARIMRYELADYEWTEADAAEQAACFSHLVMVSSCFAMLWVQRSGSTSSSNVLPSQNSIFSNGLIATLAAGFL